MLLFESKAHLWSFQTKLTVFHSIQCLNIYLAPQAYISSFCSTAASSFHIWLSHDDRQAWSFYLYHKKWMIVRELPKIKEPLPISHEDNGIFSSLFWHKKGDLGVKQCYLPSSHGPQWWDSSTPSIPQLVSVSIGGKHRVTRGGNWMTYDPIDDCWKSRGPWFWSKISDICWQSFLMG